MAWIILIAIIIYIFINYYKRKPPEEKETKVLLSVSYQKAEGHNWCLPASGAMIMDYYKEEASQKEIAQYVMINQKASLFKFMTYIKELGFLVEWGGKTMEEIEDLLREGIPLIVIQNYSIDIRVSHSRVIIGFDSEKKEIILHDPSGKKGYNMNYEAFHDLGFDTSGKEKIITIRRG